MCFLVRRAAQARGCSAGRWRLRHCDRDAGCGETEAQRRQDSRHAGRGGDQAGERGKHDLADAIAGHPQRERGAGGLGRRQMNDARDRQRRGNAHGEAEDSTSTAYIAGSESGSRQHQKAGGAAEHAHQGERHAADREDQPGIEQARDQRRHRAHGQEPADMRGIDLPLRAHRRQIDHQQIERGHGHDARQHHGDKAAQLQQLADRDEIAGLARPPVDAGRPDQQRDDRARGGGGKPDREQMPGRRHRGPAAEPADDERAEPLPDRGRHHVIPEHGLPAARAARADRQHLVAGHAEHVAEAQQHAESRADASPIAAMPRTRCRR